MVVIARKKKPMFFEDAPGRMIALKSFGADCPNVRVPPRPSEDTAHSFRSVTALPKRINDRVADLTTTAIIRSTLKTSVSYERLRLSINNCPRQPIGNLRRRVKLTEHEGNKLRSHRPLVRDRKRDKTGKRRATGNERFQKRSFQDEELQSGGCERCLQTVLEVA